MRKVKRKRNDDKLLVRWVGTKRSIKKARLVFADYVARAILRESLEEKNINSIKGLVIKKLRTLRKTALRI